MLRLLAFSRESALIKFPAIVAAALICLIQLLCVTDSEAAGAFQAHVSDTSGRPAADAVVALRALDFTPPAASRAPGAVMDQRNRRFVPHVLPVQTGTAVTFPNGDDIRHQVYSFSSPKRFELPLYRGSDAPPVTFDTLGVVALGCNIHDWMLGYIYVTDTPYFGKSDGQGDLRIEALPAGRYEVRLWHPQANLDEKAAVDVVSIDDVAEVTRSYVLELPKKSRGAPSVPAASSVQDKFNRWQE